jgi:hypothetical protein
VDEDEGDPAEPIVPKVASPEIQWVSIAAGTRQPDDNLERSSAPVAAMGGGRNG